MYMPAELFLTFAKIGLFTFGGGYAMLSLIENKCVEQKKWLTGEEMANIIVIAESTPGPVAINCATYTGYKKAGMPGAVAATLGMMLPSLVIIYLISIFLDRFIEIAWIANAFKGIKLAVGILIIDAAVKLMKILPKRLLSRVIICCSVAAMLAINYFALSISSIVLMLAAAFIGFAVYLLDRKGRKEPENHDLS